MTIYKPLPPQQKLEPLPREYPQAEQVIVIYPPYTGERLTAILRFVTEAVERGEDCPITVLKVK